MRLDGIASVQAARRLSGRWVYADIGDAGGLDDGEYYHYQLVGLEVVTDEGEHLGEVREVLVTGVMTYTLSNHPREQRYCCRRCNRS